MPLLRSKKFFKRWALNIMSWQKAAVLVGSLHQAFKTQFSVFVIKTPAHLYSHIRLAIGYER